MLQPLQRKIDCVVRVVTPENIEFEYMVAGPFQRIPAFLIDLAVRTNDPGRSHNRHEPGWYSAGRYGRSFDNRIPVSLLST